jgi:hypothetical protein
MPVVLGVFEDEKSAKQAINKMKDQGISEDEISLVARQQEGDDFEAGDMGGADQNLSDGAATGGVLGGLAGLLAGAGMLTIPGVGPILAAGPISAGLSGAAAGGIAGGLADFGVDEETGQRYAQEVEQGKILVAAENTENTKIDEVASLLREEGAKDVETH